MSNFKLNIRESYDSAVVEVLTYRDEAIWSRYVYFSDVTRRGLFRKPKPFKQRLKSMIDQARSFMEFREAEQAMGKKIIKEVKDEIKGAES